MMDWPGHLSLCWSLCLISMILLANHVTILLHYTVVTRSSVGKFRAAKIDVSGSVLSRAECVCSVTQTWALSDPAVWPRETLLPSLTFAVLIGKMGIIRSWWGFKEIKDVKGLHSVTLDRYWCCCCWYYYLSQHANYNPLTPIEQFCFSV